MDVFDFRDRLVNEYARFTRSFVRIRATDIKAHVDEQYGAERFWPAPMVQLNPAFVAGGDIGKFVAEGLLDPECERIFRAGKTKDGAPGTALTLHKHQEDAIRIAQRRESYVLTTGTGSTMRGKWPTIGSPVGVRVAPLPLWGWHIPSGAVELMKYRIVD